jgi:tRNA(Ile)-lysidine synthase
MTGPSRPDDADVGRFRADLARLRGEPEAARPIALAVSGGPDSMAMLALAAAAYAGGVIAATVDHGLRPESAGEAAMVAACCAGLGVTHSTLVVEAPPGASGNLQAWARQERYRLLKRWAADARAIALCTAHHADDQAETFLMRAARATGVAGLAGVRARHDAVSVREWAGHDKAADGGISPVEHATVALLRPLLHWRRHELRAVADVTGMPFVDDPSNADDRFDRTRFRTWLASAPWIDPIQIGRTAEHMADAAEDLTAISRWLWTERALPSGEFEARFDVSDLPRGLKRYLARLAIEHVHGMGGMPLGPQGVGNIEPLLDALEGGRGATHRQAQASADGSIWHFRRAPPRRSG